MLPSHYETPSHYHEEQEETYFVHQGEVEFILGDGTRHLLGPGGLVRVDPEMPRGMRNAGDRDAILVVAGGKGGYVGRDGIQVQESTGDPPARTSPGDAPAGTSPGDAPAGDGPAATGAPGAA